MIESVSESYPQDKPANRRNELAFVVFVILYVLYIHIAFLVVSQGLVYGIQISDVDTGYIIEAGMFYILMAILYFFAFILLAILYFVNTKAKRLALAGVVLPIGALHIARALITTNHPVVFYY